MTPARHKLLTDALAIIADVNEADAWDMLTAETRTALAALGATFPEGNTNTMRLAGVTASCAWDKGEHLITRWAANARAKLAEGTDDNA
jgi:hypothetical protein